jgi:hypothetical protein
MDALIDGPALMRLQRALTVPFLEGSEARVGVALPAPYLDAMLFPLLGFFLRGRMRDSASPAPACASSGIAIRA